MLQLMIHLKSSGAVIAVPEGCIKHAYIRISPLHFAPHLSPEQDVLGMLKTIVLLHRSSQMSRSPNAPHAPLILCICLLNAGMHSNRSPTNP